jgi:hypothetical protein
MAGKSTYTVFVRRTIVECATFEVEVSTSADPTDEAADALAAGADLDWECERVLPGEVIAVTPNDQAEETNDR